MTKNHVSTGPTQGEVLGGGGGQGPPTFCKKNNNKIKKYTFSNKRNL